MQNRASDEKNALEILVAESRKQTALLAALVESYRGVVSCIRTSHFLAFVDC